MNNYIKKPKKYAVYNEEGIIDCIDYIPTAYMDDDNIDFVPTNLYISNPKNAKKLQEFLDKNP